jgi:UDP-N-acetylglucosamine:LPS N-acetylglucosamine transferase
VSTGGARLLADADCDEARLADILDDMLSHPEELITAGEALRALGRPDAAARVANLVVAHARRGVRRGDRSVVAADPPEIRS